MATKSQVCYNNEYNLPAFFNEQTDHEHDQFVQFQAAQQQQQHERPSSYRQLVGLEPKYYHLNQSLNTNKDRLYPQNSAMFNPLQDQCFFDLASTKIINHKDIPGLIVPREITSYNSIPRSIPQTPPFSQTETVMRVFSSVSKLPIKMEVRGQIDKGFSLTKDDNWTGYRRNYFKILGAYSLSCSQTQRGIPLRDHDVLKEKLIIGCGNGIYEPILDFCLGICARVHQQDYSVIELVQLTVKRDKGPQNPPTLQSLHPGGNLDLMLNFANDYTENQLSNTHIAIWNRIQFKQSTANNRRKKASQQYFSVYVELFGNIGSTASLNNIKSQNLHTCSKGLHWMRLAYVRSCALVVRGRSPAHYKDINDIIKDSCIKRDIYKLQDSVIEKPEFDIQRNKFLNNDTVSHKKPVDERYLSVNTQNLPENLLMMSNSSVGSHRIARQPGVSFEPNSYSSTLQPYGDRYQYCTNGLLDPVSLMPNISHHALIDNDEYQELQPTVSYYSGPSLSPSPSPISKTNNENGFNNGIINSQNSLYCNTHSLSNYHPMQSMPS